MNTTHIMFLPRNQKKYYVDPPSYLELCFDIFCKSFFFFFFAWQLMDKVLMNEYFTPALKLNAEMPICNT